MTYLIQLFGQVKEFARGMPASDGDLVHFIADIGRPVGSP